MGVGSSKMEKALVDLPDGEKYFGLENFGNTCYCNSVLQALYFCKPFREQLLLYAERLPREGEENLLTALADLFLQARGDIVGGVAFFFLVYRTHRSHTEHTHLSHTPITRTHR